VAVQGAERRCLPHSDFACVSPPSWRAWDGKGFIVRFADPYREAIAKPEEHVYDPVLAGEANSLLPHTRSGNFIITQFVNDDGFYI
jgi:hypothetical protein